MQYLIKLYCCLVLHLWEGKYWEINGGTRCRGSQGPFRNHRPYRKLWTHASIGSGNNWRQPWIRFRVFFSSLISPFFLWSWTYCEKLKMVHNAHILESFWKRILCQLVVRHVRISAISLHFPDIYYRLFLFPSVFLLLTLIFYDQLEMSLTNIFNELLCGLHLFNMKCMRHEILYQWFNEPILGLDISAYETEYCNIFVSSQNYCID